jgi:hypothetical protein
MSDIGGITGKNPQQTQYPSFESPGGITPQQTALADYDYGQNLTEGQAQFEGGDQGGGPIMSTMATQTAGGANIGKAIQEGSMSDTNETAAYDAYKNAINIDQQNNAAALAEQQQSQQTGTTLGTLAGKAAGFSAGSAT